MNNLADYQARWTCDGDIAAALHLVGANWEGEERRQYDLMIWAGLKPHHKFLDLGCGVLRGTLRLTGYVAHGNFYGADVSDTLIRLAAERLYEHGIEAPVQLASIQSFDLEKVFPEVRFDRILSVSVLTHLLPSDVPDYFKGIRNALSEGAQALISCLPIDEHDGYFFTGDIGMARYKVSWLRRQAKEVGLDLREVDGDYENPVSEHRVMNKVNTPFLGQWVLCGRKA